MGLGVSHGQVQPQQPQQQLQQQPQQQQQQKHDIFVGNLDFNTTEEQLHQIFSDIGRLVRVRMVTDQDTGKPRGFAFVEFEDPQAALSAIRNMNDYELNGRRIRVNFSNSSHLEALAGKLGMDLPNSQNPSHAQHTHQIQQQSILNAGAHVQTPAHGAGGTLAVADSLKSMSKGELYDVVAKLKEIADRDPEEARRILTSHPQLPEAILFAMSKLEMVQTPSSMTSLMMMQPPPVATAFASQPAVAVPVDPRQRADPRQAAQVQQQQQQATTSTTTQQAPPPLQPTSAVAPAVVAMPPAPRADPRARIDPRRAAATAATTAGPPPPPPPLQQQQQQQAPTYNVPPNLDPSLVQQVMSLTVEQISRLPPDQSQSIMALRNQITGGR